MSAKGGPRATIGVEDGYAYLLPEQDEDPEHWRNRARQAWVHAADFALESLRMIDIARAQRLETLYLLLDGDGVHFRFEPGAVPKPQPGASGIKSGESGAPDGGRRHAVHVERFQIEGLLLEYARLKDEGASARNWQGIPEHLVLIAFEVPPDGGNVAKFFEQCDGDSSVRELADRLGWPLRQVQIAAEKLFQRGLVRAAAPAELLSLAHAELLETNVERAAARLVSWIECSRPGLLDPEDASLLAGEWEAERLGPVLSRMPLSSARRLVQRLSRTIGQPLRTIEHWAEVSRIAQHDTLVDLHLLVAQIRASVDPNVPAFKTLLEVARGFTEMGHPLRGAALLRIAAGRRPSSTEERLLLGTALLAAGQPAEAVPWIVAACNTLLAEGKPERAVEPLRQLVELVPNDREARRLLTRARAFSMRRALVKKNSLVTMAVVLSLSIGAIVQYKSQRTFRLRVDEIEAQLDDPNAALGLLETYFAGDTSDRVAALRERILEAKRDRDTGLRTAWTDRYREAQLECTLGDPVLGLRRALEVPPPPRDIDSNDPWPLPSDLFNGIAARVQNQIEEGGEKVDISAEQEKAEDQILALISELRSKLAGRELSTAAKEFGQNLQGLEKRIQKRAEERAALRKLLEEKSLSNKQNLLLGAARAYKSSGDFERARQNYASLIESDTSHKLTRLLEPEISENNAALQALKDARALCLSGRHAEARALLVKALPRPGDYLLPWKVESAPTGAKVRLPDGSQRETPFTIETTLFEAVELAFEAPGCEPKRLAVTQPGDQHVYLSRLSEQAWKPGGRIDALPLSLGKSHILADRDGALACYSGGALAWSKKLETLAGFARAPVALPGRPGWVLLLSEDGEAWVVDSADGTVEGPSSRNVAPLTGPYPVGSDVLVRFRDSTIWRWSSGAAPEPVSAEDGDSALARFEGQGSDGETRLGISQNFVLLRRSSADKFHLDSPWNDLQLDIVDGRCSVSRRGDPAAGFSVELAGEWVYAAFESPLDTPHGRLWISDGRGLRTYIP